jgi:hypothetical protein
MLHITARSPLRPWPPQYLSDRKGLHHPHKARWMGSCAAGTAAVELP